MDQAGQNGPVDPDSGESLGSQDSQDWYGNTRSKDWS